MTWDPLPMAPLIPLNCTRLVSYGTAVEVCRSAGMRICTLDEFISREPTNTGCNLNDVHVWSSSDQTPHGDGPQCEAGGTSDRWWHDGSVHRLQVRDSQRGTNTMGRRCRAEESLSGAVRCCQDAGSACQGTHESDLTCAPETPPMRSSLPGVTTQSTTVEDAARATDGDTNACSVTDAATDWESWWQIDLGVGHAVFDISIVHQDGPQEAADASLDNPLGTGFATLTGARVVVSSTSDYNDPERICAFFSRGGGEGSQAAEFASCGGGNGRYVTVAKYGTVSICEIEVHGIPYEDP